MDRMEEEKLKKEEEYNHLVQENADLLSKNEELNRQNLTWQNQVNQMTIQVTENFKGLMSMLL